MAKSITQDFLRDRPEIWVKINFTGQKFDNSVALLAPEASVVSITEDINTSNPLVSPDYLFLNTDQAELGTALLCPEPLVSQDYHEFTFPTYNEPFPPFGYVSKAFSDLHGFIHDKITVRFSQRTTQFIRLQFCPHAVVRDAKVRLKDSYQAVLNTLELQDNQSEEVVFPSEVDQKISYIELEVFRIAKPFYPFRLYEFSSNLIYSFDQNQIKSLNYDVKKNGKGLDSPGGLFLSSIKLELFNYNRWFDFFNKSSPHHGLLSENKEVEIAFTYKGQEYHLGIFYTDKFTVSEDSASVRVTCNDMLNVLKKQDYSAPLVVNRGEARSTSYAQILETLLRISRLHNNVIDEFFTRVYPDFYEYKGKVSKQLSDIADMEDSYIKIMNRGDGVNAQCIRSVERLQHHQVKHFFAISEYTMSAQNNTAHQKVNRVKLEYNKGDLKKTESVLVNEQINYRPNRSTGCLGIPISEYQDYWYSIEEKNYIPGTYLNENGDTTVIPPSMTFCHSEPEEYTEYRVSDPYMRGQLEYTFTRQVDAQGQAELLLDVWLFDKQRYGADYDDVYFKDGHYYYVDSPSGDKEEAPEDFDENKGDIFSLVIVHAIEDTTVPIEETAQEVESLYLNRKELVFDQGSDYETINQNNSHEEVNCQASDSAVISSVVIYNRIIENKFYYIYDETHDGVKMKVWNYLPTNQNVQIKIYGRKMEKSSEKQTITVENTVNIVEDGLIEETVSAPFILNEAQAKRKAEELLHFYTNYSRKFTVEIIPKLDLKLGDMVAFESMRGYEALMGIVQEIKFSWTDKKFSQKIQVQALRKSDRWLSAWGDTGLEEIYFS